MRCYYNTTAGAGRREERSQWLRLRRLDRGGRNFGHLVWSLLWTRNTFLLLSSVLETSHLKRIKGEQIKKILCRHIYEVLTSSTIASLSLVCESWRLVVRADWVPALRAGAGASVWRELTEPVVTVRASQWPISDTWSQWRPLILFIIDQSELLM